jgi:hypothetical protein
MTSETASSDYPAVFVERAVMAPDVSKVDTDRRLDLRQPAWNFSDEVMHRLHGKQSHSRTCSTRFVKINPYR